VSENKGLGRFFKSDESDGSPVMRDNTDAEKIIGALQTRITELEGASGRQSFIDMDEDALTQIAAEDAAVIIRAARMRAGKLIEQATEALQQAESEREQIRASCELDARQTREAANVDARKLRAEATATLETARDQAAQLLEATQNDADSQAEENQKVITKLLDDATRRANEVAKEIETLKLSADREIAAQRANSVQELTSMRATSEAELNKLRAETEKSTFAQLSSAQTEAKRLQTEAINATQSMLEKATGDARALSEDASKNYSATIADGQNKLQFAEAQAEQILSQAQTKADEIVRESSKESKAEASALRQAAIAYRDNVLVSVDANRKIFDDLTKQIAQLRAQWFDAQSAMTQMANQAGVRFTDAESSAAEFFARITDSRAALSDTFADFAQDITNEKSSKDN
jgi:uncharacterized protein Smg (DUF494 family)